MLACGCRAILLDRWPRAERRSSRAPRADGFVLVPADLEGYAAGAVVKIWLYDS